MVSEYLQGQNRQVLESSSISSCRGWHSESRAHSGTSEDDEGRRGGLRHLHPCRGLQETCQPGLGTQAWGLLLALESMGFMCFQRISCI